MKIDSARDFESVEELRNFYNINGYVYIKNIIPINLIENIQKDLIKIFEPYSIDDYNPVDSAIIELNRVDKRKLYELHTASSKTMSFKEVNVFSVKLSRICLD